MGNWILGTLVIIFSGFVLLIFIALGTDLQKTMSNGVGWVWQDRHGVAISKFIKEENGCVYYVDVWDVQGKTCGNYSLNMNH